MKGFCLIATILWAVISTEGFPQGPSLYQLHSKPSGGIAGWVIGGGGYGQHGCAGLCGPNARCEFWGHSYKCKCQSGYQGHPYKGCQPIDPCLYIQCGPNSRCKVVKGKPACQCLPGFVLGPGGCKRDFCYQHTCGENAYCKPQPYGRNRPYSCVCLAGYIRDGRICRRDPCYWNNCDQLYGRCIPTAQGNQPYTCECIPGYLGDGRWCKADLCYQNQCHGNAICIPGKLGAGPFGGGPAIGGPDLGPYGVGPYRHPVFGGPGGPNGGGPGGPEGGGPGGPEGGGPGGPEGGGPGGPYGGGPLSAGPKPYQCQCLTGFVGNGFNCFADPCLPNNTCHQNAKCIPQGPDFATYNCKCLSGFFGNGQECIANPCNPSLCHPYARCIPNLKALTGPNPYSCRCRDGFFGNGAKCFIKRPPRPRPRPSYIIRRPQYYGVGGGHPW